MTSAILSALTHARSKRNALTPLSPDAADLCAVLDHQLALRDRQHADLVEDWRKLRLAKEMLEARIRRLEQKLSGKDSE